MKLGGVVRGRAFKLRTNVLRCVPDIDSLTRTATAPRAAALARCWALLYWLNHALCQRPSELDPRGNQLLDGARTFRQRLQRGEARRLRRRGMFRVRARLFQLDTT